MRCGTEAPHVVPRRVVRRRVIRYRVVPPCTSGAGGGGGGGGVGRIRINANGSCVTDGNESPAASRSASCPAPPPPPPDSACTHLTDAGNRYHHCTNGRTWNEARTRCQSNAGWELARIDGAAENTYLTGVIGADTSIGASDSANEGVWRWNIGGDQFWSGTSNGSSVGGLYSHWDTNEPNDSSGEDCALLRTSGFWNDEDCDNGENHPYLCEGP